MTTLERIAAITEALNSCTAINVCAVTIRKPLEDLRADLENQLRAETARTAGTAGITRTVTRILNGMKKEPREALRYAWIDKNDRQCICNGYMAFRFTKHLPLPPRPENAAEPIDLSKIFPSSTANYHRITTPAIADVKMCIANAKAAKCSALFDLGDNEPYVDAKFLLDVLNAMPDCEMYTLNSSNLYTEEQAIKQIAGLERDELELEKRLSRIRALRRYYTNAAAMLRSSRKTPVYFLNRKTNLYSDKKITYTIMKGYYNHDLRKFAVTEWEVQKFSGKEHREAFKAFEKLLAETPDARGFTIRNGYYDHIDYNTPDCKA